MGRKQNEELTRKEEWEETKQYADYGLPPADIKVMVMQLFDSARRLLDCGDPEGARDALNTASLYAADASMDPRFRRAVRKLDKEIGLGSDDWRPKFNPQDNNLQPAPKVDGKLKTKLLR